MTDGKRVNTEYKATITDWNLDAIENLTDQIEAAVRRAVDEFLELALQEPARAYLPIQYSVGERPCDGIDGKPVTNPLLLYISVPLGEEDRQPTWSVDLSDLCVEVVEYVEHGYGGYIDKEDRGPITSLRDALQKQVDLLTEALNRPDTDEEVVR